MSKQDLLRELQELLNELFSPTMPRKHDDVRKGGLRK